MKEYKSILVSYAEDNNKLEVIMNKYSKDNWIYKDLKFVKELQGTGADLPKFVFMLIMERDASTFEVRNTGLKQD